MKVTPKLDVGLDTSTWGVAQSRQGRILPAAPDSVLEPGSEILQEYLDWVAYLDDLARQAKEGRDDASRRLAMAKLRFLQRRVVLLHEQMMQEGRSRVKAGLEQLSRLVGELEQVVQELTGRQPEVVDEWPLPYRLYSREQERIEAGSLGLAGKERRRRPRSSRNLLQHAEQQVAHQVLHGIRFVFALVRDGFGMAQHPLLNPLERKVGQINSLIGPEKE